MPMRPPVGATVDQYILTTERKNTKDVKRDVCLMTF